MELPRECPVMTLPNVILFPQAVLPLYIFENRYRRMLADALASHRMFSVAMQKPGRKRETPCSIAGIGVIRAAVKRHDGTSNVILQGIARVELGPRTGFRPYRVHEIRAVPPSESDSVAIDALTAKVLELVSEKLERGCELSPEFLKMLGMAAVPSTSGWEQAAEVFSKLTQPEQIVDLVASRLLSLPIEQQILLETADLESRLKHLIHFLLADLRRQPPPPPS